MSVIAYQLNNEKHKICIVVGLGLVGGAISKQLALRSQAVDSNYDRHINWNDPALIIEAIKSITKVTGASHLELIWSAGKAGFSASEQQMLQEYDYYKNVIQALSELENVDLTVNLISSAGGIYENSGLVHKLDDISPSRPYAIGKLQQESLLIDKGLKYRIYRASSVYGIGGSRMGLINTMLESANQSKPMMIYADQNTLRDYLYFTDLGKCIVDDVLEGGRHEIKVIASGRATSINTLLNLVRNITKKPVLASFSRTNKNSNDIVFAQHLINTKVIGTSLEEGIRILNKKMLMTNF